MGTVPIWKQWLMVMAGVFLSLVFAFFLAWFIGWPRIRRLWTRSGGGGWDGSQGWASAGGGEGAFAPIPNRPLGYPLRCGGAC